MNTKRNLFTFALGGLAGYIIGRYPEETFEKVRGGAGITVGLCRERIGMMTERPFLMHRNGDHRAATAQPAETGDDVIDRTSTAFVSRPHP